MRTAICIASGPSLTQQDVDFCRGKAAIYAVKEVRLMAPWADVLYAADGDWWDNLYKNHSGAPDFAGRRVTLDDQAAARHGLELYKYKTKLAWSDTPGLIATNGNSGFQAINIAVLEGAERIILLGYDMGHASGTPKHCWTDKFHRGVPLRESDYKSWIAGFQAAAPLIPVPVINCTPGGRLECFQRADLRDAL